MFFLNYPSDQRRISRKIKVASDGNVAVLGSRKSGKTTIVAQLVQREKGVIPVYLRLDRLSLNPENLAVELIGNVASWFLGGKRFLGIEDLKHLKLGRNSEETIAVVANELEKIKPDQRLLVKKGFEFTEALAKDSKKKFIVVLENIERILDLNNFSQIRDVLSLLDFKQPNTRYVVTSSFPELVKPCLKDFKVVEVGNLSRNEALELGRLVGVNDEKVVEEVCRYTHGHIFFTKNVLKRYLKTKDVKKAIVQELTEKDSLSFLLCKEIVEQSLSRARGATLLYSILKVLAQEKSLKLSEIARRIYHSAPVTKSLLSRLIEVGLVVKKDSRFMIANPMVASWIRLQSLGREFEKIPGDLEVEL